MTDTSGRGSAPGGPAPRVSDPRVSDPSASDPSVSGPGGREPRHDFIDNLNGNTLAQALADVLGEMQGIAADGGIGEPGLLPDEVRIATAYFSPAGFAQVADHLGPVASVRLMLGVALAAAPMDDQRRLGESNAQFERRRMAEGLDRMDRALRLERDRLPFIRSSAQALRKLITALRSGNMVVRRYEKAFLHAKAWILTPGGGADERPDGLVREGIIAGSSNLTGAGLTQNLELNLARYDAPVVEQGRQWFDALWAEAEPCDLAVVFEEALQPCMPWQIFIRVLWQLYGDEVEEDARQDDGLPLTGFQKHGVTRALRLIRETGGAIVADEVGLGKTFIAGEVMQIYHKRRQRVLLVCPAALRDSTWKKFLARYQMFAECLSFEELAKDIQLRDAQRPTADQEKLQRPLDEYQLIVVDEAHNYRNPDAPSRAAVLRRLLFGQQRDVLLLTATPVNNSLWDLYHLVRFFVRQDAHFANRGILSVRERFDLAMREDPSNLSPDILYPVIDATTVKRTRQFVKKHYSGDTVPGPDGQPVPIVFPEPRAISVRYNLDDLLPGFFDRLEAALDPDSGDAVSFARYRPDAFLRKRPDDDDEKRVEDTRVEDARTRAMVGLLRSGLLKRFESSAFAFRKTTGKMVGEHNTFLEALDAGFVVTTGFMKELSADDDAVFKDVLEGTEHRADATLYDTDRLRKAVEHDRDILRELADEAATITPDRDPKLQALLDELVEIARQAVDEAADGTDEAQKRKVLVFSFFEDTVEWIRDYLKDELECHIGLAGYRDRMAVVSGSDELGDVSRQQAVQGFAPVSMEAPGGAEADRYDLLISTDVLAEGVNLQQCRHIINFDMPWNPMRLVQRHGRIDRIASPHARVLMRTIFPADRLDRLLNLEQRILDKLAMAAASVGVAAPIEGASHGHQVFTETRDEIEKLLKEDASLYERGGTAGAAQTGEEYRQTLRKALEADRERIVNLPWKAGSGMVRGNRRGVFFCAVAGDGRFRDGLVRDRPGRECPGHERTFLRFVAADDDWSLTTGDGAIIREVGTCLRLIECEPGTPVRLPDNLQDRVYDFWAAAQDDILKQWEKETDPANLQPKVRPLNLRVAEFIRANQPPDMADDKMKRALDILESPWPRREEVMLRDWFENAEQAGAALSRFLIDQILETGLEPVEPPDPLPPIEPDDIRLLCWMGIECAGEAEKVE